MLHKTLLFAFTTLFVVVDPIGLAMLFLSLTPRADERERRVLASRAVIVAAGVLLGFAFAGDPLLQVLGVSLSAFQIAGGILLLLLAIDMVMVRQTGLRATTPGEDSESVRRDDISVFPLAIPLIAGPGALTSVIMLMNQANGGHATQAMIVGVLLFVLLLTFLSLCAASLLLRLLGVTGINVVTRIAGILLAALAVQFMVDGFIQIAKGVVS